MLPPNCIRPEGFDERRVGFDVGGPIVLGCFTVLTGMLPQATVSNMCVCVGPPDSIVKGLATVLVGGLPAARLGDMTAHGGTIVMGCPTVLIGG